MQPLARLSRLYRFNDKVIDMTTDGFSIADWLYRPSQSGGNHAYWILGHLALARRGILRGLGRSVPAAPWEEHFKKGSKLGEGIVGPQPDELRGDFHASGETLAKRLEEITPEEAAAPYVRKYPDGSEDVAGAMQFMLWHEANHLGQLTLLRRAVGKPGLA